MFSKRGFSLAELLVAMALMGVIILAVTSVDITSRRFFAAADREARIQNEAKIAMGHIARHLQVAIGDRTNPGASDGFIILGGGGRIQINQDTDRNGRFEPGTDIVIEYRLIGNRIRFDPDISVGGDQEDLTESIISNCLFSVGGAPNEVDITISVREQPAQPVGRDNPETTLTSTIVLRAMSTN